ncbi:MAG: hypothetical protein U9P07_11640, partial [Pseudomonadota bacterium]|nr:hypothetical protein [Pseudomonadota bacterium]
MKTMMDFITAVTEDPPEPPTMEESAINISNILSGLYRQKSPSEWEWLKLNRPEWWTKRISLENKLDGHFLNNNLAAGQEVFYRLLEHLKTAPIG